MSSQSSTTGVQQFRVMQSNKIAGQFAKKWCTHTSKQSPWERARWLGQNLISARRHCDLRRFPKEKLPITAFYADECSSQREVAQHKGKRASRSRVWGRGVHRSGGWHKRRLFSAAACITIHLSVSPSGDHPGRLAAPIVTPQGALLHSLALELPFARGTPPRSQTTPPLMCYWRILYCTHV